MNMTQKSAAEMLAVMNYKQVETFFILIIVPD